jgi:glycosyltransferase involved in cell wall biosynthesis
MQYDLSFIIPAKNSSHFIFDMIESIQNKYFRNWEVVIIDDHSTDDLYVKVKQHYKNDNRIKIFKNDKRGKVFALNMGYKLCSGKMIKCVDSDDTLCDNFFEHIDEIIGNDIACHDYHIVDENLNDITQYTVNRAYIRSSYEDVLSNLISLPRAVWSFSREVAEKIFPLPENLPFEDVWFSLMIKKTGKNIFYIHEPLYNYRQHSNQTFGGILKFSKETMIFRAKRMLRLIDVLKIQKNKVHDDIELMLNEIEEYYKLLGKNKLTMLAVVLANLRNSSKLKLILFRKLPFLAKYLTIVKWKLQKLKET